MVRSLDMSDAGITAAIRNQNETVVALVLRLTACGKPDSSINGNGRPPFSFGGADCPYGLARTEGRIAAVGKAQKPPVGDPGYVRVSEDFAVAMCESVAAPMPTPP